MLHGLVLSTFSWQWIAPESSLSSLFSVLVTLLPCCVLVAAEFKCGRRLPSNSLS